MQPLTVASELMEKKEQKQAASLSLGPFLSSEGSGRWEGSNGAKPLARRGCLCLPAAPTSCDSRAHGARPSCETKTWAVVWTADLPSVLLKKMGFFHLTAFHLVLNPRG